MRRRLLHVLTALSLLACVLLVVLWVLSYWVWCRADLGWVQRSEVPPGAAGACIARAGSWPGHLHVYFHRITDADERWWEWAWAEAAPAGGLHVSVDGWRYGRWASYRQRQFILERQVREAGANPWTTPNGGMARRGVTWTVGAPYWFLATLTAAPPGL